MFAWINRCRQVNNSNAGFTLVEVLVAMLVLSILTIPMLLNFKMTFSNVELSAQRSAAENYAQQIMETLQADGAETVDSLFKAEKTKFTISKLADDGSLASTTSAAITSSGAITTSGAITREYSILGGVDSNGNEYDVRITYEPAEYYGNSKVDLNSVAINSIDNNGGIYPDASVLSDPATVVVDPGSYGLTYEKSSDGQYAYDNKLGSYKISNGGKTREDVAVDMFFLKYSDLYGSISKSLNKVLHNSIADGGYNLTTDYNFTPDDLGMPAEKTADANLKKYLNRRIMVLASGHEGDVNVSATIGYFIDEGDVVNAYAPDEKYGKNGDNTTPVVSSPTALSDTMKTNIRKTLNDWLAESKAEGLSGLETNTYNSYVTDTSALETSLFSLIDKAYAVSSSDGYVSEIEEIIASREYQYLITEQKDLSELERVYIMYVPLEKSDWVKDDNIYICIQDDNKTGKTQLSEIYKGDDKLKVYVVPQIGLSMYRYYNGSIPSDVTWETFETENRGKYLKPYMNFAKISIDEAQDDYVTVGSTALDYHNMVSLYYLCRGNASDAWLDLSRLESSSYTTGSDIVEKLKDDQGVLYDVKVEVFRRADRTDDAFSTKLLAELEKAMG